jgi:hypothetical protein
MDEACVEIQFVPLLPGQFQLYDVFKVPVPVSRKNSVRDVKCPRFLQVIKHISENVYEQL